MKNSILYLFFVAYLTVSCVQNPINTNNTGNSNLNQKNNLDPTGGGLIDPKTFNPVITLENGNGKIALSSGSNNLNLNLHINPPANAPSPLTPLTGLKVLNLELLIDGVLVPVTIQANQVTAGLNYFIEISGLKQDSQILLNTKAIDKNNAIMGTGELNKKILNKSDFSQLNIDIQNWW